MHTAVSIRPYSRDFTSEQSKSQISRTAANPTLTFYLPARIWFHFTKFHPKSCVSEKPWTLRRIWGSDDVFMTLIAFCFDSLRRSGDFRSLVSDAPREGQAETCVLAAVSIILSVQRQGGERPLNPWRGSNSRLQSAAADGWKFESSCFQGEFCSFSQIFIH